MNNKFVIAIFILFVVIVFFSSLQTVSSTQKAESNARVLLQQVTLPPTPTPTPMSSSAQAANPTPTSLPVFHPGFRINGGNSEFGDD